MEVDWRWDLITRVVAGTLGIFLLFVSVIAAVSAVAGVRAGDWSSASVIVVILPSVILGRLFLLGAWAGEEPEVSWYDFDDDDPDHVA